MTSFPRTAAQIRSIAKAAGLAHAEFCLDQAETQIGDQPKARAELWRLMEEARLAAEEEFHNANMTALDADYDSAQGAA